MPTARDMLPTFLDFFAGSGLVTEGMATAFRCVWANDNSTKKAAVYQANFGKKHFHLGPVEDVKGTELPRAALGWASFPCQDLSLAGSLEGIEGRRSGLVWQWLRVIDEMGERRPPILVAENVPGLVSANDGAHYRALHVALRRRGYKSGAIQLDAVHWVPQSRPRIFVISVLRNLKTAKLAACSAQWMHSKAIQRAAEGLDDFIWWKLPKPPRLRKTLADIIEFPARENTKMKTAQVLALISPAHQTRLLQALANGFRVAPGYRRMRNGKQVLELRFDGISGCLRTPEGGSSRQTLILSEGGRLTSRLVTVRETARLMGVRDSFKIPGNYNDGYRAMGDAVAVPVVQFLAEHLLKVLGQRTAEP